MYGRNIKLTSMFGIALMVFVIAIIPITMFLTSSGSVDIVFNQEAKVSSLQYDVSVLEHQLGSFQCPEVKCKDSPATFCMDNYWLTILYRRSYVLDVEE